ncbi:MAG: NusG domain II-containing protein [Desulfomonilaceae bacterium]
MTIRRKAQTILNMRAWIRYFTPGDIFVILLMFLLAAVLSVFIPSRLAASGNMVFIKSGAKLVGRYSLNHDQLISVNGPLGETKVQIKDGKVRIVSSPCPNHYCVKMGHIDAGGCALVCIPNQVIVRVGGNELGKLDAISR